MASDGKNLNSVPTTAHLARWTLRGCTALVTGGSRGIGRGVAEELATLGASVYICARTQKDIDSRLQKWREAGLSVEGSVCDVTSREARIQLIQKVSQHFGGKLDILVNNAGTGRPNTPFTHITQEDYSLMMSTNLESAFHLCQLAHPLLKASTRGNVVFISSIAGVSVLGKITPADYCIPKAALNHLTKTLASDWSVDGIRVNCVAPGVVWTDLTDPVLCVSDISSKVQRLIPIGEIGKPEDISGAVAFFCMPCSRYCTGQVLVVDGGMLIKRIMDLE